MMLFLCIMPTSPSVLDCYTIHWGPATTIIINIILFSVIFIIFILVPDLSSPFAIDVFESSMYWVSKVNGTLQRMNKFGLGVNVTLVTGLVFPQDVKMLHALKQPQGNTLPPHLPVLLRQCSDCETMLRL